MDILGELNLNGNVLKDGRFEHLDGFPETPEVGTWAFINKQLMLCVQFEDLPVWVPLTPERNTYKHVEKFASTQWSIPHLLDQDQVMIQCFDGGGNIVFPSSIEHVDSMSSLVTFPDAILGTAIVMFGYTEGAHLDGKFKSGSKGAPIGMVHYAYAEDNIGENCLPLMGQTITREFFPEFFEALYEEGIDSTVLTDSRGLFNRNLDHGRGKDAGRVERSVQAQSHQSHNHSASVANRDLGSKGSSGGGSHSHGFGSYNKGHKQNKGSYIALDWADWRTTIQSGLTTTDSGTHAHSTTLGTHNHSVTINDAGGLETRPENIALLLVIKIR